MLVLTDCTDLLRRGEANVVYCGFIVRTVETASSSSTMDVSMRLIRPSVLLERRRGLLGSGLERTRMAGSVLLPRRKGL